MRRAQRDLLDQRRQSVCLSRKPVHASNLEQPELFNDAVREFCLAHSTPVSS